MDFDRKNIFIAILDYAVTKTKKTINLMVFSRGADRDRTDNLRRARAALSQLSYSPNELGFIFCGAKWIRTTDLTLIRRAL